MADFKGLLNKKVEEAERPPLLPAGVYEGVVKDYTFGEARNENKTPLVTFNCQITGATEDVDVEDLVDDKGNSIDPAGRRFRQDFFLTEDALYRLREFLESCGIDVSGRSFAEALPDTKNAPVLITLAQGTSQKTQEQYNNIAKLTGTANVE